MIGVFRTLLIIIGLYVVVLFIMNLIYSSSQQSKSAPHTNRTSNHKKSGGSHQNDGDYVDYEEIKD